FQAEDGIRDGHVTGVQTCALPIFSFFEPCFKALSIILNFKYLSYLVLQAKLGKKVVPKSLNYLKNFRKSQKMNTAKSTPAMYTRSEERRVGKESRLERWRVSEKEE